MDDLIEAAITDVMYYHDHAPRDFHSEVPRVMRKRFGEAIQANTEEVISQFPPAKPLHPELERLRAVREMYAKESEALRQENERLRNDLYEAAESLRSISRLAGKNEPDCNELATFQQIRRYANSRATVAWGGLPTPSDECASQ